MKKNLFLITSIFAALVLARIYNFDQYLTLAYVQANAEYFKHWVDAHEYISMPLFVALHTLVSILPSPGVAITTLAAGFLFGLLPALTLCMIGSTVGATTAFFLSRYAVGSHIQKHFGHYLSTFNKNIEKHGQWFLLTLRLTILVPFFVINYLSGLTKIAYPIFAWTTIIGMLPSSIVLIFAGKQLGGLTAVHDVLTPQVILALGSLAVLSLLPLIARTFIKTKS